MGYCKDACTPTYRGFDTFTGMFQGMGMFYDHTLLNIYDWWDGTSATGLISDESVIGGQYSGCYTLLAPPDIVITLEDTTSIITLSYWYTNRP